MRSGRPSVAAAGEVRLPELTGTDTPAPPYQTPFGQRGPTTDHHLGMIHTRKSKAWAVWRARAWKGLDRVAEKR
jgi:hypothetical protein